MSNNQIISMIPARIGSTRLKMKNLALINDKPLIYYAIKASLDANLFNRIVVNSDAILFKKIAERYGVEFYHRPKKLGSSTTKSDHVIEDFINKNPCDILVWVNPTSPLQTGNEIIKIVNYFIDNKLDTLITVKNEQVHCLCDDKPVNFNYNTLFAQTQDLKQVLPFVYSIMMWRTDTFIQHFNKGEKGILFGNVGYYPVSKMSSVIIKTKYDLMMAESLLKGMKNENEYVIQYDKCLRFDKAGEK